jgi:hypothetical protein
MEVLIKSVGQAIPTNIMGIFKLLGNLYEEMIQMMRQFWWDEEGWHGRNGLRLSPADGAKACERMFYIVLLLFNHPPGCVN